MTIATGGIRGLPNRRVVAALIGLALVAPIGVTAKPKFTPRQFACVGSPPRQTEDPLSPACQAFYDGDNGGSTWHGVERDSIRIVLSNDLGIDGDMTAPYRLDDEMPDHESDPDRAYVVRTIKALVRYFTKHYMTYGRRPEVWAVSSQGRAATPAQRTADALVAIDLYDPFAAIRLGSGGEAFMTEFAEQERMSFGAFDDVPAATFSDHAPYLWSFWPDTDLQAQLSAGFVCRTLLDDGSGNSASARFATEQRLRTLPRSVGIVAPTGTTLEVRADLFADQVAARCGAEVRQAGYAPGLPATAVGAVSAMRDFAGSDVTTVICYCEPRETPAPSHLMQTAAFALGYGPEWFWDPASELDDATMMRRHDALDAASFGITTAARATQLRETHAYRAYLSEEPGTIPNTRHLDEIYHALLVLFAALQQAGSELTPFTVQEGMEAMVYRSLDNPFVPAGGFEPGMPSPFTFVDTAMSWWWDPDGTPPGGRRSEGCVRTALDGTRSYADTWPAGDGALFIDSPCSGDRRL